jgi:hypothetical protein
LQSLIVQACLYKGELVMYRPSLNNINVYPPLSEEIARQQKIFEARLRDRLAEIAANSQTVRSEAQAIPLTNRVVGQFGHKLVVIGSALQHHAGTNKACA